MTANQEIELKLRVTKESLAVIRKSPWWKSLGRARRRTLNSVYFDTPDGLLRSHTISLRVRNDGNSTVQTVKMTDGGGASIARREWEVHLPDTGSNSSKPNLLRPDLDAMADESLPSVLRKLKAAELVPILEMRVVRSTKETRLENFRVEYAVDQGEVRTGSRTAPISEIELELLDGDAGGLFATARQLNDVAATRLHLQTKSETGLLLGRRTVPVWFRKPRVELSGSMTGGDVLKKVAQGCLKHLTLNDDCALMQSHEEGVHQCRVALRRLRSVLWVYRRDLPVDIAGRLEGQARWLMGELAAARDLLVFRTQLLDPIITAVEDKDLLATVKKEILVREASAQLGVQRALSSCRYGRFLIDLAEFAFLGIEDDAITSRQRKRLARPARTYAEEALSRSYRKLRKRGRKFESLSTAERHDVRIAVKKLRYGVDFFKGLFEGRSRHEFSSRLAGLQDKLGRLNDVATAQDLVRDVLQQDSPDQAGATELPATTERELLAGAGIVLGWQIRRAEEIEGCLARDWSDFSRMEPFWNCPV